jgi:regulator of nucleoside diphosphate kinase
MAAQYGDPEYGWIVPSAASSGGLQGVLSFVEKPDLATSQQLAATGALVNTFVFASHGRALVRLYEDAVPELLRAFVPIVMAGASEPALRELYDNIPSHDFSRGVLERTAGALSVLAVPPCGWSDIGTPARLERLLGLPRVTVRRRSHTRQSPGGGTNSRDGRALLTDVDARQLKGLVDSSRPRDLRDAVSVALLDRQIAEAEVLPPDRIGPEIVTMGSKVRVRDLETRKVTVFRIVFPRSADAAARKISVLAPLGMAVLGRRVGDHVTLHPPHGPRRLRLDRLIFQPERDSGVDRRKAAGLDPEGSQA